jgi:DNA primase
MALNVKELKKYIYDNSYVEQILENIGCHNIRYHSSGGYWTAANKDGNNKQAIVIRNNEYLPCNNYTRQMVKSARKTDIIDLVCYTSCLMFPEALKKICNDIGVSYYQDFDEDIPESFKILKMIEDMDSNIIEEKEYPLKPISESILTYYKKYVNDLFYNDHIDYQTQKEFEIGYDEETNRITIPIRSEIGDLVGVKGRLFKTILDENDVKYLYIEPCNKSKILYGIYKTIKYVKNNNCIYVLEAEKSVLQLWNYGYKNAASTGGKQVSQYQIEMLVRLESDIIFCFDKDVTKKEIAELANRFPDGIPLFYMFDEDNILNEKESPSDNPIKWEHMVNKNIYKLR